MTLSRIRTDRSLRSLPIWAIAALINSSVLLGIVFLQRATQGAGSIPTTSLLLVCWLGAAVYLAFGAARTRCSTLDLSLPIAARSLWLSHVVAVVIGGAVVIGLSLAAVALHDLLLGDRILLETGLPALTALLAVGLVLATLLLQAPSPSLRRIPLTRGFVLWAILVLAGTPAVLALAARAGFAGVALLLLATGAVGVWLYRSVPPTFTLVPLAPNAGGDPVARDSVDIGGGGGRPRMVLPLTVLGGVSGGIKEILTVPFVIAFAAVLGGGLLAVGDGGLRELRFNCIPMVTYMLIAFVGPRLMHLHHLDALPIRRRTICAALLLPYLLMIIAGYFAGAIVASGAEARIEYVNMEKTEAGFAVTAPLRVYDVAWDGKLDSLAPPCLDPDADKDDNCIKADVGKNQFYISFALGTPQTSAALAEDFGMVNNLVAQQAQHNAPEVNWITQTFYPPMGTVNMWDFGDLNYEIFNTEIARRAALMTQPLSKALVTIQPEALMAMPLFKEGIINQGGPADIMARRIAIDLESAGHCDNDIPGPGPGGVQPEITLAEWECNDDGCVLLVEGEVCVDGNVDPTDIVLNIENATTEDFLCVAKVSGDYTFSTEFNVPGEEGVIVQECDLPATAEPCSVVAITGPGNTTGPGQVSDPVDVDGVDLATCVGEPVGEEE